MSQALIISSVAPQRQALRGEMEQLQQGCLRRLGRLERHRQCRQCRGVAGGEYLTGCLRLRSGNG